MLLYTRQALLDLRHVKHARTNQLPFAEVPLSSLKRRRRGSRGNGKNVNRNIRHFQADFSRRSEQLPGTLETTALFKNSKGFSKDLGQRKRTDSNDNSGSSLNNNSSSAAHVSSTPKTRPLTTDLPLARGGREATPPAHASIHIATFNARTLTQSWRVIELAQLAQQLNVDIIGIQEHRRVTDETVSMENGWMAYFAPARTGGHGGVGFLCAPTLRDATLSFTALHHRIASLSIELTDKRLHLLTVHMPTATGSEEDTAECIDIMSNYLRSKPKGDICIILGDMNADLPVDGVAVRNTIRDYNSTPSDAVANQRAVIADFVESNELAAVNAVLRQKQSRLVTFYGPQSRKARLDYIFVPARWIRLAKKVRTVRPTCVRSDHAMVTCNFTLKLWRPTRHPRPQRPPLWPAIHNPIIRKRFVDEVLRIHAGREGYLAYIESIHQAAEVKLPKRRNTNKVCVWENDVKIANARRNLAKACASNPSGNHIELEEQLRVTYDNVRADYITKITSELNQHHESGRGSSVWRTIDQITGRKQKIPSLVTAESIKERLMTTKNHFQRLLNAPSSSTQLVPPRGLPQNATAVRTGPVTYAEVVSACRYTPHGKAAGPDRIPPDVLHLLPLTNLLVPIMNDIIAGDEPPPDMWRRSIIVTIPKKGGSTAPSQQRGISLMCVSAKFYNRVLLARIRERLEEIIYSLQAGFRPGRSTTEQILTLRIIIDSCRSRKRNIVIVFVDFAKAFDNVSRSALQSIMQFYGIPMSIIHAVMSLYIDTKTHVRTSSGDTDAFDTSSGVLQGDTLAPYLFVLVMDFVLRQLNDADAFTVRRRLSSRHLAVKLPALAFADDIALLCDDSASAQRQLARLEKAAESVGLKINEGKTEVLHIGCPSTTIYGSSGAALKSATDFAYLGFNVRDNRDAFLQRRRLAWVAARRLSVVWEGSASDEVKMELFISCVESVLLYSSEALTLTPTLAREVDGGHRALLRFALCVHFPEKISNDALYARANTHPVTLTIQKKRLALIGHALRRPDTPLAIALSSENRPTEPFRVGGSLRKTYADQFLEDLQDIGINPSEAVRVATNKLQWLRMIKKLKV